MSRLLDFGFQLPGLMVVVTLSGESRPIVGLLEA